MFRASKQQKTRTASLKSSKYTVKLGYNKLGYNKHSVITNKTFSPKWPLYYTNQPGYNKPRL